jgi:hypothetical protein
LKETYEKNKNILQMILNMLALWTYVSEIKILSVEYIWYIAKSESILSVKLIKF